MITSRKGFEPRPPIARAQEKVGPPDEHGCREWLGYFRERTAECRLVIASGLPLADARLLLWEHATGESLDRRRLPHCRINRRCVEPSHQGAPGARRREAA